MLNLKGQETKASKGAQYSLVPTQFFLATANQLKFFFGGFSTAVNPGGSAVQDRP